MSSNTSPMHYVDDPFIKDADFKVNINQKMTVPHKISFNDPSNGANWAAHNNEPINMQVPSRILVAGQNSHIGTKAPPREIDYDNSFLANDPYPNTPRVSTPPRTLTLDKYSFPDVSEVQEKEVEVVKPLSHLDAYNGDNFKILNNANQLVIEADNESQTYSQEISHLRREMAKLNRRVMDLESQKLNRSQTEKILGGVVIVYFIIKAIVWLNKSSY